MIRPIAVLTAAATATLALAGCSADVSSGQGSTAPPTKSALERIVLQTSDLPAGWASRPAAARTREKSSSAQLAACVGGTDAGLQHQILQVRSPDFRKGTVTISSDMSSYPANSDVDKQVALLTRPKSEQCLQTQFQRQLKDSLPTGSVIENADLDLDTGHQSGSANLIGTVNGKATITLQGTTVSLYLDESYVTGRNLTGTVSFTSVGAQLPTGFTDPIVAAVAKRASHA